MRVAVFSMGSPEVEPEADALMRTIRAGGHSCVRVGYWTTGSVPLDALADAAVPLLTLVQGGLASAPRLDAEAYARCGGAIGDFADLTLHDHAVHGWPVAGAASADRLSLESAYYQRLRGCAVMARNLLRALAPDLAVVQQGAEPVGRAIAVEADALGIPVLVWDSAFFPGFVSLDVGAQHFFRGLSRIDRRWPQHARREFGPDEIRAVEGFIERWRAGRSSRHPQADAPGELARLDAFAATGSGANGGTRLAFLPAQLPWDASVISGLGAHASLRELYEAAIARIGAGWRVVVKVHPKDAGGWLAGLGTPGGASGARPELLVVADLSIHDLIERADLVLVHSSNVGLEALLYAKPVVVLGTPHYAGKGLTADVPDMGGLDAALARARPPGRDALARFVHFLIADHLIPIGDAARFDARAAEAMAAAGGGHALASLAAAYPPLARAYLETVASYSRLALCNYSDAEIRAALGLPGDGADAASADGTEPCLPGPYDYCHVEPPDLARYLLACAVVAPGARVLDLACGVGYGAHLLAERGCSVDAVDASADAIAFARAHWGSDRIDFHTASAGRWLERPGTLYDAVVSFGTIERAGNPRLLLRQLWARVRPGGLLLASVPDAGRHPVGADLAHVRHFDHACVVRLIKGLESVSDWRAWPQGGAQIGPSVRAGQFLVAALVKAGPGRPPALDGAVPLRVEGVPARKRFRIGAAAFRTTAGRREQARIVSEFEPTDCHIVFGPYRPLAAGRYEVAFELQVEPGAVPGAGAVTLDVASAGAAVLARRTLSGAQLVHGATWLRLAFDNAAPHLPLEFRVHVAGRPVSGSLAFAGVTLTRIANG